MSNLQRYYDAVANNYSKRERNAYHRFLNDASANILKSWLPPGLTLDAGCGCGHISSRLAKPDRTVIGSDLSLKMLQNSLKKQSRPLAQASVLALPFPDNTFNSAYCLRVFPHLADPHAALNELSRVVKPGGPIVIDIYNRCSIRTAVKTLISHLSRHPEFEIPTRFDSIGNIRQLLPKTVQLNDHSGLRIITPTGHIMNLPGIGYLTMKMENLLNRSFATRFGGFLLLKLTVTS